MTSANPAETATVDVLDALSSPGEMEEAPAVVVVHDKIKAFVDNGQKQTEAKPRAWFFVTLPEAEVKRVTRDAKKWARATGRVFRVKNTDNPTRLVYRVVAKVTAAAEAPASAEASE